MYWVYWGSHIYLTSAEHSVVGWLIQFADVCYYLCVLSVFNHMFTRSEYNIQLHAIESNSDRFFFCSFKLITLYWIDLVLLLLLLLQLIFMYPLGLLVDMTFIDCQCFFFLSLLYLFSAGKKQKNGNHKIASCCKHQMVINILLANAHSYTKHISLLSFVRVYIYFGGHGLFITGIYVM